MSPFQSPPPQAESQDPPQKKHRGGIGAILAALGAAAVKFKVFLLALVHLPWLFGGAKILMASWSLILSFVLYLAVFGWQFAIILVLVLVLHELGHYVAFRSYGLPAKLPVLVPFLGAFTIGQPPEDLEHDAYIALAGPLTGLLLSLFCAWIGSQLHDPFWLAIASVSAFLNIFNMMPMLPFDGGRIIAAIWPALWIAGMIVYIGVAVALHIPLLFIIIIGLLGLPTMIGMLRGTHIDERAAAMTLAARVRVGAWYLITLAGLGYSLSLAPVVHR